jgi:hypothetical protein
MLKTILRRRSRRRRSRGRRRRRIRRRIGGTTTTTVNLSRSQNADCKSGRLPTRGLPHGRNSHPFVGPAKGDKKKVWLHASTKTT